MTDIYLHGKKIESVFELLGKQENDITYSIGWSLANSPSFLNAFFQKLRLNSASFGNVSIELQEFDREYGITDIEIRSKNLHIIIEAKRGWVVPDKDQLNRYIKRFIDGNGKHNLIVSMSECNREYAGLHLANQIRGIPLKHYSWKDLAKLTTEIQNGTHAEKRLLQQLRMYLRRIVNMQDQQSNMVYVVSLGQGVPEGCSISWIDIVEKRVRYFHPVGKTWPSKPPNYLGFRYDGRLQRIHHVDSWKVVDDLHSEINEIGKGMWGYPHYLYTLGPAILPTKEVKYGKVYPSGRVWATLDLLMTCNTVSEARDRTLKRINGEM